MALSVDDFNVNQGLSPEDFDTGVANGVILNDKTSSVQAATTLAMTGEGVENFSDKKGMVSNPETRPSVMMEQEQVKKDLWKDAKSALPDILADGTVLEEDKVRVMEQVMNDTALPGMKSSVEVLAEGSSVAPLSPTADEHEENSVDLAAESIKEVVGYRSKIQKLVNDAKAGYEITPGSSLVDMLELAVPLAEYVNMSRLEKKLTDETELEFLGQKKQKIYDFLKGMSLEDRYKITEAIIATIQDNSSLVLPDGNDIVAIDTLDRMLLSGEYSNFERWFDNVFTVLDVAGIVGSIAGAAKLAKVGKAAKSVRAAREAEITAEEAEAAGMAVRTDVSPASPAKVAGDVNEQSARNMHELVVKDETGAAAKATHGTTRNEAIADDLLPKATKDDTIPHNADQNIPRTGEDAYSHRLRTEEGNTILSDVEWEKLKTKIVGDFRRVAGMYFHANSLAVRTLKNGHLSISAKYHPVSGGFSTATEAVQNAKHALRTYGIREEDIKLLVRSKSGRWRPESARDATARQALVDAGKKELKREYGVEVRYDYSFRPEDLDEVEMLTTGGGFISRALQFADRWPAEFSLAKAGQGSLLQNLLDSASLIHPRIVNAASVAVDKTFRLQATYVKQFEKFTKEYSALSKERRGLVSDYIHQANFEGIPLDENDLIRRGFTSHEREILREWRRANDTMWYAANQDTVISLRSRGWKIFDHKESDTSVVGRAKKRAISPSEKVYDPVHNTKLVGSSDEVMEALNKETPSTLVELKEPIEIDGDWVSYMISMEDSKGGFLRSIADDEVVLAYRQGYYPVMYDANYFITKKVRVGQNQFKTKAVATARTKEEAENYKRMIMSSDGISEAEYNELYAVRQDRRSIEQRNKLLDEGSFNIASNSDLSMQKVRGERLADAGVNLHNSGYSNLKDPLEAIAEQVRQLSRRTGMRKYLDTAKRRWMLQFGDHLDLPLDAFRNPVFPKSVDQIKKKAGGNSKMWQEAKTNFNYLYSLENGYINLVDKGFTTAMHFAAETLEDLGLPKWLSKGAHKLAGTSPTHSSKSMAFRLFLSSNPMRQGLIQRMQLSQLAAFNPKYMASGKFAKDLWLLDRARTLENMGRLSEASAEAQLLLKEVKDLGILQAVDSHTLIRDDYLKLADATMLQKAGTLARRPLDFLQHIGFDFAEQDVLAGSYFSFRDLAVKRGEDLADIRVREKVLGQARAAVLNMNRSGDIAHSHNTLAPITQFLSFQHKMLLQPFTNRNLTLAESGKLLALNTLLFGVPSTGLYLAYDKIFGSTEPNPVKDFLRDGLLDIMLNSTLSALAGEDIGISTTDIAPLEAYGISNIMLHFAETPLVDLIAESPAGSLFFGNNPRLKEVFSTGAKVFVPMNNYDDPTLKVGLLDVARAAASSFSGYSTVFKANYAFETGTAMSSSGRISDSDVHWLETVGMLFGLSTKDQKAQWRIYELKTKGSKRFFRDSDVENWYKELKRVMARRGMHKPEEMAFTRAVLGEAWRVFGQDRPRTMKIIRGLIAKDHRHGDHSLVNGLYKDMGLISDSDWWRQVNQLPDNDIRDQLIEFKHRQEEGLQVLIKTIGD